MQLQLDPNIPANLSPEELRDFKSFLDIALEGLTTAAGGEVFTTGNGLLGGLALIVVVLTGGEDRLRRKHPAVGTGAGRHGAVGAVGDVAVLHHPHSGHGVYLPGDDRGGRKLASRTADRRCRLLDADRTRKPDPVARGEPGSAGPTGPCVGSRHRRDSCSDNGGFRVGHARLRGPHAAAPWPLSPTLK